jgi:tetratricopeptide (TPR) repeat protein
MQAETYISSLIQKLRDGRVALLCGAGISIPAGLPSATALASRICELICPNEASKKILIDEVCNRHQIPFEAFIEIVLRISGNSSFLEMFSEGQPAAMHLLTAQLGAHGAIKTIVTTNFDVLFERALLGKLPLDSWRVFATDTDFSELTAAALKKPTVSLLKVHGSYGGAPTEMVTTLRQLGQRNLLDNRMKAIDHLFRDGPHEVVLILGYSCSDAFDVNPRIESFFSPLEKTVVLVQHTSSSEVQISQLNKSAEHLVFSNCNDTSCLLRTNTASFLGAILEAWDISCVTETVGDLWSNHVERWFCGISASVGDRIVAAVFRRCGFYSLAESHYEAAIKKLNQTGDLDTMADVLTQLGVLLQIQGRYYNALEVYERALKLLSTQPSRVRSTALYQIGRVKEETGDYRAALDKYEESMAIDKLLGDREGVASCLHQTGILYQEYFQDAKEAELRYRGSLEIKWEIGDLEGVFNTLHQLSILELIRSEFESALSANGKALALAERLSLKHSIAHARNHRGYILQMMGRLDEAETECRQSLRLRQTLKDVKGIAKCYHRLGEIEQTRRNFPSAIRLLSMSLRLKESIGDRFGVADDIFQISEVLRLAGHPIWSEKCRVGSYELFTKLGCDPKRV